MFIWNLIETKRKKKRDKGRRFYKQRKKYAKMWDEVIDFFFHLQTKINKKRKIYSSNLTNKIDSNRISKIFINKRET